MLDFLAVLLLAPLKHVGLMMFFFVVYIAFVSIGRKWLNNSQHRDAQTAIEDVALLRLLHPRGNSLCTDEL